jgi:hypothetical protein
MRVEARSENEFSRCLSASRRNINPPGRLGWALCRRLCFFFSACVSRWKASLVLCLQAIAGVCLPLEKVDSHKVHKELQLENNAPPWLLKRFQLQLMFQLQVQLRSKVKSKSLHLEFSSAPLSPSSSSHSSSRTLPDPPPTQPKSNSDRLQLKSTPAPGGLPALDDLGCSCSFQLGYKST